MCVSGLNLALWRTLLPRICGISMRPSALFPDSQSLHYSYFLSLSHTHKCTVCHLWLTRDFLYIGVIVSFELSLLPCVCERISQGFCTMATETQPAKVIRYYSSAHDCLPLLTHPALCLLYAHSYSPSVSPELHRRHKEGGRKLILRYCWLGLALSYDSKHRGRRITRQIGYMPDICAYKNCWYGAALATKFSSTFHTHLNTKQHTQ